MPGSSPIAPAVSVIGLSDYCMGMIRAAIRTEVRLPDRPSSYEAALDDVLCRESSLVIIGVDENRVRAMALSQQLVKEHDGIRLIAISEQEHRYGVLDAMRAGFSEYLLLPEESETLRRSIHRRGHAAGSQHLGKLIAIVGTKGGCGVSTITVHLAAQLASMHRVCAVDMDFGMGDVAAMLSLEPESSIHELLSMLPELSQREILRAVSVHHSHVHVLPQPSFLEDPEDLAHADLRSVDVQQLLFLLREAYQYILLDCSGALDLPTLTSLRDADQVWLICTPDVLSTRNAWRRLRLIDQLGISRERVRLVVNRWRDAAPLTIPDIESNLGIEVAGKIHEDRSSVEQAATRGVLIREINAHSPVHLDIARSVSLIAD